MLDTNQIANIFTDNCSVTMPAEKYLFIYTRMKKLEYERGCLKEQVDMLKKASEKIKKHTGIDIQDYMK